MTEEDKIYSISEVFSSNPYVIRVADKVNGFIVDRIEPGCVYQCGDPYDYYIGWTSDNRKIFEFRKESVNVIYMK